MFWLGVLCAALLVVVLVLAVKMALLHRAMDEVRREMEERLRTDTNTLISVSGGGRHLRQLAADLNVQLRQLRRERRQLQNGNRELKDAVTNISHDLRTPLTAILGYLDLLEDVDKSPAAARYISHIKNRADALQLLMEELFSYTVSTSRADATLSEPVCLGSVLEESIASFYAAFKERDITPNISMPQAEVCRILDKAALSRVFDNVLGNALKYSGGDLAVSLSATGEVIFSNTAPGLDEVHAGMLFNRFYTVETARNSTGLGLAISHTLVEQMGGTIEARYANGRLSIAISFPASTPGQPNAPPEAL